VTETPDQRQRRERQRLLFDGVADRYEATRLGYPEEALQTVLVTAGIVDGGAVLEIGCGTGQLTRSLAGGRFAVTAIDPGPATIAEARHRIRDDTVEFVVSTFEDFPEDRRFDLVVSGTAFHWVDPAIAWNKTARLLKPSGWLALLHTGEQYPEPFGGALRQLWEKYSGRPVPWPPADPPWIEGMQASPWFGSSLVLAYRQPLTLTRDRVVAVERTRATFLGFAPEAQAGFTSDLRDLLREMQRLDLEQETFLAMAPVVRQD
jgi:ubiquinone/menaquinone biosynthesis C-methylase UbiE